MKRETHISGVQRRKYLVEIPTPSADVVNQRTNHSVTIVMEIARYRTGPQSSTNPSRTTVDLEGNCWLGNRQTGTAIKIGLLENNCYIDRNQNGVPDTCRDLDGNGVINADEILPWGSDECVLYEVILIPGREGTYTPGNYTGPYVNDNNNPGPRGIAVDSKNNVWLGTYGSKKYYHAVMWRLFHRISRI